LTYHGCDAPPLQGNGFHRALQLGEGHSQASFSLALQTKAKGFNDNREHAAIGLIGAACKNMHAGSAPVKPADHRERCWLHFP
jgi:hypothetical protein